MKTERQVLASTPLVRMTPLVRVAELRCRAPAGRPGEQEVADLPRFVVPRRGVFSWHLRGRAHLMRPGMLLWFAPGEPYRFGHPIDGGDDCLMLGLDPQLWAEIADRAGLGANRSNTVAELSALASLYVEALLRVARIDGSCGFEEFAMLCAGELAGALATTGGVGQRPRSRRVGLAEQAAAFVAAHYRERIPRLLDAAAAEVNCSPFHLARVFRRDVGCTMHAFRERLRLADALYAVTDGASDVAELADRLGYASHSHLTDNFRRAYGLPPTAVRGALGGPTVKLRKILEAPVSG